MTVELKEISKRYPLKTPLDKVSTVFATNKIHALLGENGAGKSTLAHILSGQLQPSAGDILIDGKRLSFSSPRDALKNGIVMVTQRPLLAEGISVAENCFLSHNMRRKEIFFRLSALEQDWGTNILGDVPVRSLDGNKRFYASLFNALLHKPRFLILDEPSAFLDTVERKALYEKLRSLSQSGCTILSITHSRAEAASYADTVTVLKEGKIVAFYASGKSFAKQHKDESFPLTTKKAASTKSFGLCMEIQKAECRPKNRSAILNATIKVCYGEITAITGISEDSISTLEDIMTGMQLEKMHGRATFFENGKEMHIALEKKGLSASFLRSFKSCIVPSDKTLRASNPNLSVEQMLCTYTRNGNTRKKALALIKEAKVNITPEEKCANLSGGMLQRLILARELSVKPRLVILCNPMHGLDIQAQSRLIEKLLLLAQGGAAICIIGAQDMPLSLCHRVYELEGGITRLVFSAKGGGK